MLDHAIVGTRDTVFIAHAGDMARLTVWRSSCEFGEPFWCVVSTLRGREFAESREDLGELDLMVRLRHAGSEMRARVWYGARGQNAGRLWVTLKASLDWEFEWEHVTRTLPGLRNPEPLKGTSHERINGEAGRAPGLPGGPPDDRRRGAGPLSRRTRCRVVGDRH